MQKNKFVIYCGLFGILTGLVLGGCGKAEENISEPLTELEENSTAPDIIYTEPPFGNAYTAGEESNENGLTEKANDILISIDDSYSIMVYNSETGEKVKSDTDSFKSQFLDILIKYINLDIEKDEYHYTDDSVTYRMEIYDSNGQLMQTIEYLGEYLYIDKVRYRETGAGTTEEFYLAIDNLFVDYFPTASFGETDTGEVDVIEEVTMEAAYTSPKGIHLVFTNHTNEEYMFGDDYELQAWQDGEWRKVDYLIDNAAFNDIGYMLAGNSSVGWGVKWTYFHGILPGGQYRITKTINKGTGKELEKYRLAAEFTITNAEENKELDEANEKAFYEKAESFGLKKAEAESYFQMLCRDGVIQNGEMELCGLVIDDFDQNGQKDIVIMVQASKLKFVYGTGCIYFYMNGEKTYCFYEEDFPFFNSYPGEFYVSAADLDNDGNTEIVFGTCGTGTGPDLYHRILKYRNSAMEKMGEIPAEDEITVHVRKGENEDTYRAYCEYLDDEIPVEAPNQKRDYSGGGGIDFYDVQCVAYGNGYALQATKRLHGRGNADTIGEATFLIVWDEDGSSHVDKWWVELQYYEW